VTAIVNAIGRGVDVHRERRGGDQGAEQQRRRSGPIDPVDQMQRPPSTSMHVPVMNAASSEAKNTAAVATSDGCDRRPSGIVAMNCARFCGVS